jgi:hypothetical protein
MVEEQRKSHVDKFSAQAPDFDLNAIEARFKLTGELAKKSTCTVMAD